MLSVPESDFSYRSATEKFLLPLWRDFLCTLPSGYWHMCENLLTEFFSSLFRDICMETYWLCPSSFAHWDICTETYRLCPSSFAHWDIYMKTYRLCPFSFAHWDIYMKTYSLCPFSFVSRDIYARKNAICPIAANIRDIMQRNDSICPTVPKEWDITEQKFSICPQTKKSPFFISRNTKSRKLSPTFVLQQTFVHYKTLQKGASCPTPFL